MADVCQTYGVAELLHRVHVAQFGDTPDPPIQIADMGATRLINCPAWEVSKEAAEVVADDLVGPALTQPERPQEGVPPAEWFLSRGWNYIYVTNQAKDKQRAAGKLRDALRRLGNTLPRAQGDVTLLYRAETITTPQGLETAGGKGSRAAARSTYGEQQSTLPEDFWALAVVGAMSVGTFLWPRQGQGNAAIVPAPGQVVYENHHEIAADMRAAGPLCPASTTTAISHYAVKLARRLALRRQMDPRWGVTYSGIAYEGMAPTGQRPKPAHGGVFPMELPNRIIEAAPEDAVNLFEVWDRVFRVGSLKGHEELALTLSDFIMYPSLERLERHLRVHLRMFLREDIRLLYPQDALERVIDCV